MAKPLAYRGAQEVPMSAAQEQAEAEDALAEALRMSLEGCDASMPQAAAVDGDDDADMLAAAISMSMQQGSAASSGPATVSAAAVQTPSPATAAAASTDAKAPPAEKNPQQMVKAL